MKYRAVLFDFDGTLTPSLPLWVKAFRIALASYDLEFTDEELIRRFFYRDWGEVAHELQLGSPDDLQQQIHAGLRQAFREATLYPEVVSTLKRCRTGGLQVALVTSAPRFVLDDVLPRLELEELFDHIVSADDVVNFKPHPEPILLSLSALLRAPHEAIMIGDSSADILAGKAAGTATALFMSDSHAAYHQPDVRRATEPDHIFGHHGELEEILELD